MPLSPEILGAVSVVLNAAVLWRLWEFTMQVEKRITACETRIDALSSRFKETKAGAV